MSSLIIKQKIVRGAQNLNANAHWVRHLIYKVLIKEEEEMHKQQVFILTLLKMAAYQSWTVHKLWSAAIWYRVDPSSLRFYSSFINTVQYLKIRCLLVGVCIQVFELSSKLLYFRWRVEINQITKHYSHTDMPRS